MALIAIADDHGNTRESITNCVKNVFSNPADKIVICRSGDELLSEVEGEDGLDMVILDNTMPGISGVKTAERLRKIYPRLPIVFLSSEPRPSVLSIKDGVIWILKPVQNEKFEYVIKTMFEKFVEKPLRGA